MWTHSELTAGAPVALSPSSQAEAMDENPRPAGEPRPMGQFPDGQVPDMPGQDDGQQQNDGTDGPDT
jgi:hypothetical protein